MPKNSQFVLDLGQGLSLMIGNPAIPSWTKDNRPKDPKPGAFGFNAQTNSLEYWDGSAWWEAEMT